jgi:hypothetical protein
MLNKLLLAIIALAFDAAILLMRPAVAQGNAFAQIANDLHELVYGGLGCQNRKLCD